MSTIKVDNIDSKDSTGNITIARPLVATLTAGSINNLNNLLTPANASVTAAKMATTDTLPAWNGSALTNLPAPADNSVTGAKLNISLLAGDTMYASGTDTLAKLAKGTAAQVLAMNAGATAPEWADAAAGGAWNLIQTSENSGSPVIDHFGFTTGITNTYPTYVIICSLYGNQALGSPRLRVTADGGSSYITATDYDNCGRRYKTHDNSLTSMNHSSQSYWPIMNNDTLGTTTSTAMNVEIRITNLCSAVATQFYSSYGGSASGYACVGFMGGYLDQNTAYNGFKIYPSGGDFMGKVTVYGIAHA